MLRILIITMILVLGPGAIPVKAAEKAAEPVKTTITADSLTYGMDSREVSFQGNVHVKRPDIEIYSDKLTAVLSAKAGGNAKSVSSAEAGDPTAQQIDRIVATGNVRMLYGGREARCRTATLTMDDALLVLEGDPVINDGPNRISGQLIKLWLRDERSEVVGGTGRVEAIFFTDDSVMPGQ